MGISPDHIDSLADKLDGLDLTDEERAILDAVFERAEAAEAEVSGYLEIEQTANYGGSRVNLLTNPTSARIARIIFPEIDVDK